MGKYAFWMENGLMFAEIKIPDIFIYGQVPVNLNGGVGTHIYIKPGDLKNIPFELIAWSSNLPIEDCPTEWKNKQGVLRNMFAGEPMPSDEEVQLKDMNFVHVLLKGIRIHMSNIIDTVGTSSIVDVEDITNVKSMTSNFIDWDSTQDSKQLPKKWGETVMPVNDLTDIKVNPVLEEKDIEAVIIKEIDKERIV